MKLFKNIRAYIETIASIEPSRERKDLLAPLIEYVLSKQVQQLPIRLHFICTHNSRRSHLSQVWGQTFAYFFGLDNVVCTSAGTEATALYPLVAEILQEVGFELKTVKKGNNPLYLLDYSIEAAPLQLFSKDLGHESNPLDDFAAIMSCNHADENCPILPGAEQRISLTYEDPKNFDNHPLQLEKYNTTMLQIASELYFVFLQISNKIKA